MRKRVFLLYTGYIWTKSLLGILFYPRSYVRTTIRRPVLLPVLFSPLIALALLFIAAKISSYLISVTGIAREAVAIFLSTTLISILFWQLLLLYLLVSYLFALLKKE